MDELFDLLKGPGSGGLRYKPSPGGKGGHRSLEMVRAFIEGYQHGARKNEGRHEWREVFTYWVNSHYGNPGPTSANGFTLIKLKVGGDDELAFDEFYRLLPLYEKDIKEIGLDGIMKRWRKNYEAYIKEWQARQSA